MGIGWGLKFISLSRAGWMPLTNMDTGGYSKLGSAIEEVPQGIILHESLYSNVWGFVGLGRSRDKTMQDTPVHGRDCRMVGLGVGRSGS